MKKFLLSLAALVMSTGAVFAQDEYMTFNPVAGDELSSLSSTITATIVQDSITAPAVLAVVQPVGGGGFNQFLAQPLELPIVNGGITINLNSEMWGLPFFENYYVQLMVVLYKENGEPIVINPEAEEDDQELLICATAYTCPDEAPATFVKYSPDNEWNGVTFEQAYEYNVFKLYYTKQVSVVGSLGTIQYYVDDEPMLEEPKEIPSYTAEWSDMDGLYVISFPYASEEYDGEDLSKIEIDITGVSAGQQPIILDNSPVAPQQRVVKNKKGLETGLATSLEPANVYSVQGTLVKKNATDLSGLQPGLYIVDGKKVVVK